MTLSSCHLRCESLRAPTVAHRPGTQVAHVTCATCCAHAHQVPHGSVRAACLGPVHPVEQFDPVHRAGTSARISSCVMCSTANVRDWAYWEEELALWSTEDLLQSELADEFVHMLQTRPGWQRISAAAERCYQLGATQVLLSGPSVRDPDHIYPNTTPSMSLGLTSPCPGSAQRKYIACGTTL